MRKLCHIPHNSAPECDGQTVEKAKESFIAVSAGDAPCDP